MLEKLKKKHFPDQVIYDSSEFDKTMVNIEDIMDTFKLNEVRRGDKIGDEYGNGGNKKVVNNSNLN